MANDSAFYSHSKWTETLRDRFCGTKLAQTHLNYFEPICEIISGGCEQSSPAGLQVNTCGVLISESVADVHLDVLLLTRFLRIYSVIISLINSFMLQGLSPSAPSAVHVGKNILWH